MTDIAPRNTNLPASVAGLQKLATNVAAATSQMSTGDAFGGFQKDGSWFFGQERIEPEEGSRWPINPTTLRYGWIFWPEETGRPTEVMVPMTDPMPAESDLPEIDVPGSWSKNFSFQARCIDGEDEGQQVIFKGSSLGFQKAFLSVCQAIVARAQEGLTDVVPVVELDASSYQHQKYGKIYTPVLNVVGWQGMNGETAPEAEPEPEPAEEEAPKTTRRRRTRK